MNSNINHSVEKWQSIFIVQVSLIKDKDVKIDILMRRVCELERQNRRLKGKKQIPDGTYSGSGDFYNSSSWRYLRYRFLVKSDRICVLCGSNQELHVDHIVPRSIDPSKALREDNLQILCKTCNFGKSNKDSTVILRRKKNDCAGA